ncbi:YbaB/EbfC family nucleoid-associated protein [Nocardia sp. NPDC004068]|uniref:YbaB/EbfC family nucleoid-associated protein n=1 Tax=Nocardia sp. NPDC004068 TaxID=3364303 RepID=UPI0036A669BE
MEDWEREQIRSANAGLRRVLDSIHEQYDREVDELDEIHRKLGAMKVHATSPNGLARVTVNASGQVIEITIADDAYKRSTPKQLSQEINAAIHGAVTAAGQAQEEVLAPIKSLLDGAADLNELVPGAPSLRRAEAQLSDEFRTSRGPNKSN